MGNNSSKKVKKYRQPPDPRPAKSRKSNDAKTQNEIQAGDYKVPGGTLTVLPTGLTKYVGDPWAPPYPSKRKIRGTKAQQAALQALQKKLESGKKK